VQHFFDHWSFLWLYAVSDHESLKNLAPADIYFGRGQIILLKRERIKRKTFEQRRSQHRKAAA